MATALPLHYLNQCDACFSSEGVGKQNNPQIPEWRPSPQHLFLAPGGSEADTSVIMACIYLPRGKLSDGRGLLKSSRQKQGEIQQLEAEAREIQDRNIG